MVTSAPDRNLLTPNPNLLTHDTVSRLRRSAQESIVGRDNFERHVGRKSSKPLTTVDMDPHVLLALLDRAYPTTEQD